LQGWKGGPGHEKAKEGRGFGTGQEVFSSGFGQAEFARRDGVSLASLRYWLRLARKNAQVHQPVQFVEVTTTVGREGSGAVVVLRLSTHLAPRSPMLQAMMCSFASRAIRRRGSTNYCLTAGSRRDARHRRGINDKGGQLCAVQAPTDVVYPDIAGQTVTLVRPHVPGRTVTTFLMRSSARGSSVPTVAGPGRWGSTFVPATGPRSPGR
jgi:transposase-like protein